MHRSFLTIAAALAVVAVPFGAAADWQVVNNLDESFTVVVWPRNRPATISRRRIPPGGQAGLRLEANPHVVQLISGGGDVYTLKPRRLQNGNRTDLKTILTPDGRRDGRINYAYMNQQGFDENDEAEAIRELAWSSWDTRYVANDGSEVDARLNFRGGGRGEYRSETLAGELRDVRFRTGENEGEVRIDGQWLVRGRQGQREQRFEFTVGGDQQQFTGQWTDDGNRWQQWNGTRRWEEPGE